MTLITKNINDNKLNPLNETALSKKTISYGSIKAPLNTAPIKDSVELSTKQQISFKGSPVKVSNIKNFFFGEKPVLASTLLDDITRYIKPNAYNPFVETLAYDVTHQNYGIAKDNIRITEPFHKNFIKAFTDLPKLLINFSKKTFGSKTTKEKVSKEIKQSETRHLLLGFWMNVTKIAGDFDKGITGEKNLNELRNIVKDGIKGKEEELSTFFKERKLSSVYSFKEGKASGILTRTNKEGKNYLEEFSKEIMGEAPKSPEESFIEKTKSKYVNQTINNKMKSKQGAFLSSAGQSATSFVARAVSGIIPAWFIAHDFYNLRILNSNDKKQAEEEWTSKFKQESGRIGIETYQGYVINSLFEKLTNKSLPFAVGLNIVNTIGSNVFSRKLTGRPILPINIKEAEKLNNEKNKKAELATNLNLEKNTVADDNLNQLKSFNSFRSNNSAIGFGAGKDTVAKEGLVKVVKKYFSILDEKFGHACPAKIDKEEFAKIYKKVKQFDREDAKEMLKIAADRINEVVDKDKKITQDFEELKLSDILEHEHIKNNKDLIIGRSPLYRYSKEVVNIIKFPFEFSGIVGRALINPVLKLFGKKPLKGPEKSSFYSEQFIKNVNKWADKVNKKVGNIDENNIKEAKGRYQKNKKNFFSTAVMDYAPHELSTAMKFTGFTTVPFLATDAYNVTLGETKNKDAANKKGNQRAVQDSARQGVSLWISYAFNQMGKALSSASLWGNAAVIAVSAFSYESLTRLLVGQPLLPTTHEKMVETEKEKAKSKNWFVKLMAGRLKTNSAANSTPAANTVTESKTANLNASDLYKKFSTNNK